MKYLINFLLVACVFLAVPSRSSAQQIITCSSNGGRRYCSADTSGGVRLSRQISRSSCRQNRSWGYNRRGVWVDHGCRAEFEILSSNAGYGQGDNQGYGQGNQGNGQGNGQGGAQPLSIRCESNDGDRHYCSADTRNGVRLRRQISSASCTEGSTWGYDQQGVWVDRGCRAEFSILADNTGYGNPNNNGYPANNNGYPSNNNGYGQTVRCESNDGNRRYCAADTRGGVTLTRRISGASCTQGSTWGYDEQGIWVDRGCRADFALASNRNANGNGNSNYPNSGGANSIAAGTEIDVRTNEMIDSNSSSSGQRFTGVISNDVRDNSGNIAIPRGSEANLVIRNSSNTDLLLDIDSVVVNGRRFGVSTTDLERKGRQGIGANKRTGEMVGGGAALGAIIGAIAGGGKGAAIGAGIGAAAGAGGTAVTGGREVKVPAETMLKFTLNQDLQMR